MTLSDRTLTLVAMIAIGLSLLAILFVILGGSRGRGEPATLAGDDAVGALLGKIDRLEQAVRALNAIDRKQQVQIEGSVRRIGVLRYDAFEDVGGRFPSRARCWTITAPGSCSPRSTAGRRPACTPSR